MKVRKFLLLVFASFLIGTNVSQAQMSVNLTIHCIANISNNGKPLSTAKITSTHK